MDVKLFPLASMDRTRYWSFGRPTKLPFPDRTARGWRIILALSKLVRLVDLPPFMLDTLADLVRGPRKVLRTDPCTLLDLLFWAERTELFPDPFPAFIPVICEKCSKLCARLVPSLLFFSAVHFPSGVFSLLSITMTPFCFFTRLAHSLSRFFWCRSTFFIRFLAIFSASFFCLFARARWCSICPATTRSRYCTQSSCPRAAASSRGVWYWLSKDQMFEPNFVRKTRQWNCPHAAARWTLVDPS